MQAAHCPDRAQAKAMPGHGGRPCQPSTWGLGPSNPATAAAAAPGRGGLQHLERRDGGLQHLGRRDDDSDLGRGGGRRHQPPLLASRTLLRPPRRFMGSAARPTDNAPVPAYFAMAHTVYAGYSKFWSNWCYTSQ
ncbi:unnamed protein product [Miscanthus lutarioriparius]|uniref:Uncharacterized protein n=1 Tax=Miscanthus lutarioriparius TaxID=422564 RepID=A0A811Q7Z5_9POAL|nr:unnamed protein product [Miscanthus lutarioriparius]